MGCDSQFDSLHDEDLVEPETALFGSSILITGGTGSFGHAFVTRMLTMPNGPRRVAVYSRDEFKQSRMRAQFADNGALRFLLGDVRDIERLRMAFQTYDYVIHAAAMKVVPACESDPGEAVKTNTIGALNVAQAAFDCKVKRVVALSTDKAAMPNTLYGATKLAAEKVFIAANAWAGPKFSVTRYGNIQDSRGSVIPIFRELVKRGEPLTVTDPSMTRFHMRQEQAVDLVLLALEHMKGGEVFIPKLPSYAVGDLARAISPRHSMMSRTVGARPGEKLFEHLISPDEARTTRDYGSHYRILPSHPWFEDDGGGEPVPAGFQYASSPATMTVKDLREVLG